MAVVIGGQKAIAPSGTNVPVVDAFAAIRANDRFVSSIIPDGEAKSSFIVRDVHEKELEGFVGRVIGEGLAPKDGFAVQADDDVMNLVGFKSV